MEDKVKNFIKYHKRTAVYLVVLILLAIAFSYNLFNITGNIVDIIYPEYIIQNSDLKSEKVVLKDFVLQENGSIESVTADPWIYIDLNKNQLGHPVNVNVVLEDATNIGEEIVIYYISSYNSDVYTIQSSNNYIDLKYMMNSDFGVRLDLTTNTNENIKIQKIVFNENILLTTMVCGKIRTMCFLMIVLLLEIAIVRFVMKKKILIIPVILTTIGMIPLILQVVLKDLFVWEINASKVIVLLFLVLLWFVLNKRFDIGILSIVYTLIHGYLIYILNDYDIIYCLKYQMFNGVLAFNILFIILLFVFFQHLLGRYLGDFMFWFLFGICIIANLIKIKFQNALFTFSDLKLLDEIIGIADQYVDRKWIILGTCILVIVLFICVKYRAKIAPYLHLYISKKVVFSFGMIIILFQMILTNVFCTIGINVDIQYLMDRDKLNAFGFGIYTLLEFSGNQNNGKPENFDENISAILNSDINNKDINDLKPTVILILAESLFEAEKIPNVEFNQKLFENLERYKVTNIISPSYGGRTASAEFEALTGLNNIFIPGDIVPYVTYLNKKVKDTGSLAREFNDNGYATYAIHPNIASYYNRDIVYENMGFQDFISKEDFELKQEDYLKDNLVKDEVFFDKILEIVSNYEEPLFIFGASIEGHSPYNNKYDNINIVASSENYDENILYELSCFGQALYNFDQQMGRLIRFFEEKERPVLIYVFGDHIPPLTVNNESGYLDDAWLKYTTPLYAYSNFCDTSIEEEYLSLCQVAPEILKKSGIQYHSYYDYIYQLRKNYPVIHKAFGIDLQNPEIQKYNCIQWDLLFGDRLLLE